MAGSPPSAPDDAVLCEEARRTSGWTPPGCRAPRVWIIDPLDGTREYGEGRADWAVHVALVEDGVPTAGAVALPALGLVLSTGRTAGASPPAAERAAA